MKYLAAGLVASLIASLANAQTFNLDVAKESYQLDETAYVGPGGKNIDNFIDFQGATYITSGNISATLGQVKLHGTAFSNLSSASTSFAAAASFEVEVVGPTFGSVTSTPVSVNVFAQVSLVQNGEYTSGQSGVQIIGPGVNVDDVVGTDTLIKSGSMTTQETMTFLTNTVYVVKMNIYGEVGFNADSTFPELNTVTGDADPTFSLDPALGSGYRLIFSDGVDEEVSAVAEPSVWAFLLCGLGGIGFFTKCKLIGKRLTVVARGTGNVVGT